MVYYLKYRPQTLSDLIGQDQVAQTLEKAMELNRLSHAYLFYGPRGVGKTSTARILAKMINCEKNTPDLKSWEGIPCNSCLNCTSITDGSNLDLIEIDAASNRGIDDIRDLRDKVKLSPTSLRKKIYIIDEVHQLTTEAFNALLKTLEEPPSHVLFILATTELNKIPQTILSRVQRLDFKAANSEDLVKALKKVVDGEKLEITDEALSLLAKRSEGSFRDCIKLLDQLSSRGEKITEGMIEECFKTSNFEAILGLLKDLSKKDSQGALLKISKEVESGTNLKEYLNSIMDILRASLLVKHGVGEVVRKDFSEEKFQEISKLAESFDINSLLQVLENFTQAYQNLRYASIPALPLEIAIVESCLEKQEVQGEATDKIGEKTEVDAKVLEKEEKKIVGIKEIGVKDKDVNVKEKAETEISMGGQKIKEEAEGIAIDNPKVLDNSAEEALLTDQGKSELSALKDKWGYVLEMIKPYNFSLEAMLRSVKIDSVIEGKVVLKVPYSFHQRILEQPRNRELLESVLSDVLGKKSQVSSVLDQRPIRVEELANVELAADDEVIKIAAEIFNS